MREITFDRFVRGGLWVACGAAVIWALDCLSSVLLPFFLAWFVAYMLYPLVCFYQYRLRLRSRALSTALALITVAAVLLGLILLVVPPTITEVMKLRGVVVDYIDTLNNKGNYIAEMKYYMSEYLDNSSWAALIQQGGVVEGIKMGLNQLWSVVAGTIDFAIGLFSAFVCLLYCVFILQDYEKMSSEWIKFLPSRSRELCMTVACDLEAGMNSYFRGQALVALCVGILFSIGFLIIGMPMAIGLGLFIGVLNLVPYLQVIGFVPTLLLALVKSANTGESVWVIIALALLVFVVVQCIQDFFLVPRIMGHAMGLKPAIILLALSVWGSILGFIGLIIALPLTTILISYYRQIIAHYDKDTLDTDDVPVQHCDAGAMEQD